MIAQHIEGCRLEHVPDISVARDNQRWRVRKQDRPNRFDGVGRLVAIRPVCDCSARSDARARRPGCRLIPR
jgi:hypothetical protein